MADGGDYDPCECIFNHEMAMRRLLSLLRSSQGYCNDNECFQDGLPGPGQSQGAGDNGFMMLTMLWMVGALLLYLMRPASLRTDGQANKPDNANNRDDNNRDPEPPAVM